MKNQIRSIRCQWKQISLYFALLLIVAAFSGCTSVKLIADYDETIEKGITGFHKKMETHLTKLERNLGREEAKYENYIDFYDQVKIDLSVIRVRAAALPKNEITVQQIDLIIDNVKTLEELHKLGISKNDIPPLKSAFNTGTTAILKLELAKKRGEKTKE